jgi:hypothetical protein
MLHNDDPSRHDDDDEMEATMGHAGVPAHRSLEHA